MSGPENAGEALVDAGVALAEAIAQSQQAGGLGIGAGIKLGVALATDLAKIIVEWFASGNRDRAALAKEMHDAVDALLVGLDALDERIVDERKQDRAALDLP